MGVVCGVTYADSIMSVLKSINDFMYKFPNFYSLDWLHCILLLLLLALEDSKTAEKYLKDLSIGKVIDIGLSLGLFYETLQSMDVENIHEEVAIAWLSKKDNVRNIGRPSWKSLRAVLQKMNLSKVLEMIERGTLRYY